MSTKINKKNEIMSTKVFTILTEHTYIDPAGNGPPPVECTRIHFRFEQVQPKNNIVIEDIKEVLLTPPSIPELLPENSTLPKYASGGPLVRIVQERMYKMNRKFEFVLNNNKGGTDFTIENLSIEEESVFEHLKLKVIDIEEKILPTRWYSTYTMDNYKFPEFNKLIEKKEVTKRGE